MKKRILSFLVTVVMVMTLLPNVVSADEVQETIVATVNGENYTDIQEAIKDAAPNGTVEVMADITVDKWIMISETLSISNGNIITINSINGLNIDGNGYTLTINSIESAGNGNRLFYDATNLNIKDLTIKYADGVAGGIGLTSGTIDGVTFDGGVTAVYPGTGNVTVTGCTFATSGTAIYYETARDNLVVTGNTFNQPEGVNVILIRGNTTFTNNTVNSGRTVNVVSGSPVVTGNDFNDVRLKVFNKATATIEENTINNLAFDDDTTDMMSTFSNNTLSEDAQDVLVDVTPEHTHIPAGRCHNHYTHWYGCEIDGCNERVNESAHTIKTYRNGNDEFMTNTCTVCGYTYPSELTAAEKAKDNIESAMKYLSTKKYSVIVDGDEGTVVTDKTNKNSVLVSVESGAAYRYLADVKYTIEAADGYEIVSVSLDGKPVYNFKGTLTIKQIKNDHVITVVTEAAEDVAISADAE